MLSYRTYSEYLNHFEHDFDDLKKRMTGWKIKACQKKYKSQKGKGHLSPNTKVFLYDERNTSIITHLNTYLLPNEHKINNYRYVGFDTESSFGRDSKIEMIQLCLYDTPTNFKVYMIRSGACENTDVKHFLNHIFTCDKLTKIGCDLRGDSKIFELFDINPSEINNIYDISSIYNDSHRKSLSDIFFNVTKLSMVMIANFACPTFTSWNFKGRISNLLIWYASVDAIAPCITYDLTSGIIECIKLPQYSFTETRVSDDYDSDLEESFSDFEKRRRQI